MQQANELVSILIVWNNLLLDFHLLLQDGHLAVEIGQLWLKLPQLLVFAGLFLDLCPDLVVLLDLWIQIDVVVSHAYDQRDEQHHTQPRSKRHFIEFRHIKPSLNCSDYDCCFTLLEKAFSQISSNLKACSSFTVASCDVSLIS